MFYAILLLVLLIAIIVVMVLPPYWSLKQRWCSYQKIKAAMLILLLSIGLVILTMIAVIRTLPPTPGGHASDVLFMLEIVLSILIPVTVICSFIMFYNFRKWRRDKPENDGEFPPEAKRMRALRNILVFGSVALMGCGIGYQSYKLFQPAPEWPEWYFDHIDETDTVPDCDVDTVVAGTNE